MLAAVALLLAAGSATQDDAAISSPKWWVARAAEKVALIPDDYKTEGTTGMVAELQARVGDREGFAQSMKLFQQWAQKTTDKQLRAYGYARRVSAYGWLGDEAGIQECIKQARTDPNKPEEFVHPMAVWLAQVGRFDDAVALAQTLEYKSSRSYALGEISKAMAKAGSQQRAVETMQLAEPLARAASAEYAAKGDKDNANYEIETMGWAWAEIGDSARAEKIADELPDAEKADVLEAVAKNQLEQKEFTECRQSLELAFKALDHLDHANFIYTSTLGELQSLQIRLNNQSKSIAATSPTTRATDADYYYSIALAQAEVGNVANAQDNIAAAENAERSDLSAVNDLRVLQNWHARIAAAFVKSGHETEAMKLADGAIAYADLVYQAIAVAEAEKGESELARQTEQKIKSQSLKASTETAIISSEAGTRDGLIEARKHIESLDGSEAQMEGYLAIAKKLLDSKSHPSTAP